MTFLRNTFRIANDLFSTKRCFVFSKNNLSSENYFGSKIEIPSPPKRPLTAYMIFIKENRKGILKENPSLSNTEQIKVLAEKWGHLSEDLKKPYELSARESTLTYGEEHKKFYESLTEEQKEELNRLKSKRAEFRRISKLKKEIRASGVPRLPNSAYVLFVQEEAKNQPVIKNATDFIKKVAELWKNMPEHTKRIYEIRAKEDKTRYVMEMKDWQASMLKEGRTKLVEAYNEITKRGKILDLVETSAKKKSTVKATKVASKK